MGMSNQKLTKRVIDTVEAPTSGQVFYRDNEVRGFALRITSSGARSFVLERRVHGKTRRVTIGRYPDITVDQARKKAARLVEQIVLDGLDPALDGKDKEVVERTLEEIYKEYVKFRRLKQSTIRGYDAAMRLAFEDWKKKPMRAITEDMVLDRFTKLSESPSRANHHMRLLQALFHYAIPRLKRADGSVVLSSSPVTVLGYAKAWHRDTRRKSYIRETDLSKWWTAVETLGDLAPGHNDMIARDYLRLLLLTGLRRNEGATLEWSRIDFKQRTLHIPMELTKNNEPLWLPLSGYLAAMLEERHKRSTGSPYVFPARSKSGHLENIDHQVKKVRKESGVDFMLHDLRRTFITTAERLNLPLVALKRLLNHKDTSVTEGYIMHDVERLREPMEIITASILKSAGVMTGDGN